MTAKVRRLSFKCDWCGDIIIHYGSEEYTIEKHGLLFCDEYCGSAFEQTESEEKNDDRERL